MTFNSNAAWQFAVRKVAANRDLLVAVAGVFFTLPSFALIVLMPEFVPSPDPQVQVRQAMEYVSAQMPYVVTIGVLQTLGALTIAALLLNRERPTVGQALAAAGRGLLPALAVHLIVSAGVGVGLSLALVLGALSGVDAVATMVFAAGCVVALWVWSRVSLALPVIAAEGQRNPFTILQRSWRLSSGAAGKLLAFYVLLGVALLVIAIVTMVVIGTVLALTLPEGTARIIAALVQSVLLGTGAVVFIAAVAGAYAQLHRPAE
jgi:hypothetical protein